MKVCTKCQVNKDSADFQKCKNRREGLQAWCKRCMSITNKSDYARNRKIRADRRKAYNKAHSAQRREYEKRYYDSMPGKRASRTAFYHAAKRKAMPVWLTEEQIRDIERVYETCPKGYNVDHIVPLRGENVSGLHVAWNLQHLTEHDNKSKNNKFK